MKASEVLRHARALISIPEKWCQGTYETSDGRYCMLGAVRAIDGDCYGTYTALQVATGGCIGQWNDAAGRQHAEVMAAYDRAIAYAESRNE